MVTDRSGRQSTPSVATVSNIVKECGPFCAKEGFVTIVVETPPNTPADDPVYIIGNLNDWANPADPTLKFTKNPSIANCYCLSLDPAKLGDDDYFIFTRGNWNSQERGYKEGSTTEIDYNKGVGFYYQKSVNGNLVKLKVVAWNDIR